MTALSTAELVAFEGGSFVLGDDTDPRSRESPAHAVTVGPFAIGAGCVTAAAYAAFVADAGDGWCDYIDPCFLVRLGTGAALREGAARFPMIQVSFWDCAAYANWRSRADGLRPVYDIAARAADLGADGYRLPTEAEWEIACRAGWDGADLAGARVRGALNVDGAPESVARLRASATRCGGFAGGAPAPVEVGALPPDLAGLHEMLGNVREWCHDRYGPYPASPGRDPGGPERGAFRVVRGGSYLDGPAFARPVARAAVHEDTRCAQYGFRLARSR